MCVVIRAFDLECVYLLCMWVCVSFIDRQMKAVYVMKSRRPDGLMGNKNLLFIYTIWLNGICFCLLVCMCAHVW